MKSLLKSLCLCLVCLLPLTIQADPTGTVIFQHPEKLNELWETNLENTNKARLIYRHTEEIWEFAIQEDGPLIVFISDTDLFTDIFLFNRARPDIGARNLTSGRFDEVWHVDMSASGDIIFSNAIGGRPDPPKVGLYLIPNQQLGKRFPKATLLVEDGISHVAWSPVGKMITFISSESRKGVYTFDIEAPKFSDIGFGGRISTFSPDGKKVAYYSRLGIINIVLLSDLDDDDIIVLEQERTIWELKWSPDGQYIFCKTSKNTFGVPVNGGDPVKIFEQFDRGVSFDWTSRRGYYPVEPKDKLTTLWGELKQ